ncbi:hypothetical protein BZA05DRAFT_388079 [Tricharina praecox]|uniref:uncharacterized protein n=1 Tax=Tricharina praecox TaxID=43433 RepID=UPI0022210936|nr:uncharacterized protein BZA05DRAFT_388079 [Tricharina praecox]KAI5856317.1 hypothetical protein BZA05DRAFT_388079 [Tricharina praecox]
MTCLPCAAISFFISLAGGRCERWRQATKRSSYGSKQTGKGTSQLGLKQRSIRRGDGSGNGRRRGGGGGRRRRRRSWRSKRSRNPNPTGRREEEEAKMQPNRSS